MENWENWTGELGTDGTFSDTYLNYRWANTDWWFEKKGNFPSVPISLEENP
jgi:hypothetical protein